MPPLMPLSMVCLWNCHCRSVDQEQYAEQLVDNVVAQKNAEVAAYKKQLEIQQKTARQAAAQRAAQLQRKAPPAKKPPT